MSLDHVVDLLCLFGGHAIRVLPNHDEDAIGVFGKSEFLTLFVGLDILLGQLLEHDQSLQSCDLAIF